MVRLVSSVATSTVSRRYGFTKWKYKREDKKLYIKCLFYKCRHFHSPFAQNKKGGKINLFQENIIKESWEGDHKRQATLGSGWLLKDNVLGMTSPPADMGCIAQAYILLMVVVCSIVYLLLTASGDFQRTDFYGNGCIVGFFNYNMYFYVYQRTTSSAMPI